MDKKLPIGIQSFEKLIINDYLYIDKTEYVYKLVRNNMPYFLSRPRRFGKSLLLSTLKAYWEGKKELFHGLKIEELEMDNPNAWKAYPIFYFDFNGVNYNREGALEEALNSLLKRWEKEYGCGEDGSLSDRFQNILISAREKTGLASVVLVDEYDKPLLDVIDNESLQERNKEVFKGFFSSLKKLDDYIQFIFITGVSKFHKVSIFSDLNQLKDISLSEEYAQICGISETEADIYFSQQIEKMAERRGITKDECRRKLKDRYDGYRFYPETSGVYNPFSLLNALCDGDFGSYWFETGTPGWLVNKIKENAFDIRKFTNQTLYASEAMLKDYTGDNLDPIPLLYQTGYLTISDYDPRLNRYTLCFPNEEVKYGFMECLMPSYVPSVSYGNGLDIFSLDDYVEKGKLDNIRDYFTALFAGITYTLETDPFEHYFQAVIYLVFTLMGKFVQCEMHTFSGRVDCRVETAKYIYLFEFKRDDSADTALKQIDDKDYSLPFAADSRKLYKIGVSFDSKSRKMVGWKVAEQQVDVI